jgi:hypothetical protein
MDVSITRLDSVLSAMVFFFFFFFFLSVCFLFVLFYVLFFLDRVSLYSCRCPGIKGMRHHAQPISYVYLS